MIASCTKEESATEESLNAQFSSSITRASGTEWESGDQIGVMVTQNNSLVAEYNYNNRYNVSFTDPEHGDFIADSEVDQIYYSVDNTECINFYAYYPYNSDLVEADCSYPIDITEQSTPKNIDFMEASTDGSGGYNKDSGTVILNFSRNMSKITIKLKEGDGVALSDITNVEFEGFYTTATYDFTTNTFGSCGGETTTITPYDEGSETYSAIVIPEQATTHTINFETKYGTLPLDLSSYTLERGSHLYFTITVSQVPVVSDYHTISKWVDADIDDDESSFDSI